MQNVISVLDVFTSYRLDDIPGDAAADAAAPMDLGAEAHDTAYFAKYLTSPTLLHLQLADRKFRRQVCDVEVDILSLQIPDFFKCPFLNAYFVNQESCHMISLVVVDANSYHSSIPPNSLQIQEV